VNCDELQSYESSSFNRLWYTRKRCGDESFEAVLESSGGLEDTRRGRQLYRDYLAWLSEEDTETKRMGFEKMCHGWIKGTKEFRKAVLDDLKDETIARVSESEAAQMREPLWERATVDLLARLDRSEPELFSSATGVPLKVAIARLIRERYLTPNPWIAARLQMGRVSTVQSAVSRIRSHFSDKDPLWRTLQKHETLGWCPFPELYDVGRNKKMVTTDRHR